MRNLSAILVTCGLRDYGTGTWEGGSKDCEHIEDPGPPLNKSTLTSAGIGATPNGAASKAHARQYRSVCPKCGARRIDRQIGLEPTPEAYVAKMVEVFREVRRVLRKDGTCWVNLGDSYAGANNGYSGDNRPSNANSLSHNGGQRTMGQRNTLVSGLKSKDLCGVPWRVAFALQADGWWLRSEIIWHKPNPMPESVVDRPTKSHEQIFLLTKSARYFYDAEAVKEAANPEYESRYDYDFNVGSKEANGGGRPGGAHNTPGLKAFTGTRNRRSVWTVPSFAYPGAHFATYPPDLIKPCILAGTSARGCCPKCGAPWERVVERGDLIPLRGDSTAGPKAATGATNGRLAAGLSESGHTPGIRENKTIGWEPGCGCGDMTETGEGVMKEAYKPVPCTVLDPFGGSGTTGEVALELGRNAILIELNPKYADLARARTFVTPGLPLA